jgi:hypothetical protein
MDCVNHSGVAATAYCQTCGKALCANCVCSVGAGQVHCANCVAAWQKYQTPFVPPQPGTPNPAAAAVLGLIPGVGAMYNGQFFKGLIHVVIFAVLVSLADHYGIFGIFIAAWVIYQSFEAHHTAVARRDGMPLPDPLGLNEVGNWLNVGSRPPQYPGQSGSGYPSPGQAQSGAPGQPYSAGPVNPNVAADYQPPYQNPYQAPHQQPPYEQNPYAPPSPGFPEPPIPPVPPMYWKRKEPIGAIILIGLGVLFLLGQLDLFHGHLLEYAWPFVLIGLGVWMMINRVGSSHGGPK